MEEIRDCKGRLACEADAATGLIETLYKGYRTRTKIPIGGTFTIEREGIVTIISRISSKAFSVNSLLL